MTSTPLSVQLYTVRDHLAADLPSTLERLASIGFAQVEPYGFVERADEYAEHLPRLGLTAPTAHAHLIGAGLESVFAAAEKLGIRTIIDPMVDPERWTTRESAAAIAREFNAVARRAAERGLTVGYHNHEFELATRIDGRAALEVFAAGLDDGVVLELDTYWAEVGGEDAAELLGRLGGRVAALHLKDGPRTRENTDQVAVGSGSMPIAAILAAAPTALPVVELDDFDGDVFEAIADSHAYLTR